MLHRTGALKFLPLPLLLTFAVSCNDNKLPDYAVLGDLRILALKADTPEANPGATVNLTPLLSDLNGNGRALTYVAQGCLDPGVGIGITPACSNPDFTTNGPIPTLSSPRQTYTGTGPAISVTLPAANIIFNGRSAADQFNGVPYLVMYAVSAADGTKVMSFRRILVSSPSKTSKNSNPQLSAITVNGNTLAADSALPTGTVSLGATVSAVVPYYQRMQNDGTLVTATKSLINTWFVTDGTIDNDRTLISDSVDYSPPGSLPSTRGGALITVLRDGIGGEDFVVDQLH